MNLRHGVGYLRALKGGYHNAEERCNVAAREDDRVRTGAQSEGLQRRRDAHRS